MGLLKSTSGVIITLVHQFRSTTRMGIGFTQMGSSSSTPTNRVKRSWPLDPSDTQFQTDMEAILGTISSTTWPDCSLTNFKEVDSDLLPEFPSRPFAVAGYWMNTQHKAAEITAHFNPDYFNPRVSVRFTVIRGKSVIIYHFATKADQIEFMLMFNHS